MPVHEHSNYIDASPRDVHAWLADPTHAPHWMPSMQEVRNLQGKGRGRSYDWTYRMGGIPLKGHSEVVEDEPGRRMTVRSSGAVDSEWAYRFEDERGGCRLTLRVSYDVPHNVLGKLAEPLVTRRNERELHLALDNVKDLVEAQVTGG